MDEVDGAETVRVALWPDRRGESGPFDIVGDVHGCRSELEALLGRLGYAATESDVAAEATSDVPVYRHPEGRRAVFVGDLVDRGPDSLGVLRLVRAMVTAGSALAVPGNHDVKLVKALRGKNVQTAHGSPGRSPSSPRCPRASARRPSARWPTSSTAS